MGKKFSDLERASSLNNGDLFAVAQVDAEAQTGYKSKSTETSTVAQKLLKGIEFSTDLKTEDKTAIGAINELNSMVVVDDTASGSVANFETTFALPTSYRASVNPIQAPGIPTPAAPLSISGRNSIKMVRTGKNLFNVDELALVNVGVTDDRYGVYLHKSGTFTISGVYNGEAYIYARKKLVDGTFSSNYTIQTGAASTSSPQTVTVNEGETLIFYNASANQSEALSKEKMMNFQIEIGSLSSNFESYTGSDYSIPLGETIYKGVLDSSTDKFTVTHILLVLNSENSNIISKVNNNKYRVLNYYCGAKVTGSDYADIYCDKLKSQTGTTNDDRCYINANGDIRLNFTAEYNTVADMIASVNSITLVYPLETPTEISLSDLPEITTLRGINNIWIDGPGEISVDYKLAIKDYIDKKIAAVQALALNS